MHNNNPNAPPAPRIMVRRNFENWQLNEPHTFDLVEGVKVHNAAQMWGRRNDGKFVRRTHGDKLTIWRIR